MTQVTDHILQPGEGVAIVVRRGRFLRVTDLEGGQVVDMAVFNADNPREKLSTSYSRTRSFTPAGITFSPSDRLTEGATLVSTICRPLMTFVRDTAEPKGMHDAHHRMCDRALFRASGAGERDGCLEIIARAMAPWGLRPEDLPDTLDINMNYTHDCAQRRWVVGEPVSRAGDHVEFRAEMDCIVALSNCPWPGASRAPASPVRVEVHD
jgi:hypothetical protein